MASGGHSQPGPLANGGAVVPAALKRTMGNSTTVAPIASAPGRYQQVFLRSEMPVSAFRIGCIAFRPDATHMAAQTVDLAVTLGLTTFDHTTLTDTFAANFNMQAPVNVIRRKTITLPHLSPGTVQPHMFMLQLATDVPFQWLPIGNLLLDVTVWGNGNNNAAFQYPLDAEAGPGTTTARVMSFGGPNDTTGKVIRESGLVVCFSERCLAAAYEPYGKGCAGSGSDGYVVPPNARIQWLSGATNLLLINNERWQQVLDATMMPTTATSLRSLAFRGDELAVPAVARTLTYQVDIGLTSTTPAGISMTFATNITDPMTRVFQGTINIPPIRGPNTDLGRFDYMVRFTNPFVYQPTAGKNLLIDITNATTSVPYPHGTIDFSNTLALAAYAWATPSNSATSLLALRGGPAIHFSTGTVGTATPALHAAGVPAINSSFEIVLRAARASTAAILVLGFSDTSWGTLPLPLDLTALGASGCSLLASFDLTFAVATSSFGDARLPVPMPNDSALIGGRFYNQFVVVDPQANALGLAFTNGASALIAEF